jgi:hypothetical protein
MRVGAAACNWVCFVGLVSCASACSEQLPERDPAARVTAAIGLNPDTLLNNDSPIPSNGGLLIDATYGEPAVTVRSTSGSGALLTGSLHERLGYRVWIPDAPMPEGSYEVLIAAPSYKNQPTAFIEITSARSPRKPELTSNPSASSEVGGDSYACCSPPVVLGEIPQSCFLAESQRYVTVLPDLVVNDSLPAMTQLLFRIGPSDAAVAEPGLFAGPYTLFFTELADEYCFDVEAFEITTGERYTFEELDRCAPHGDLPAPAVIRHEVPDYVLYRGACSPPPAGFEERWCALNEAACLANPAEAGCTIAGQVCRGEPAPSAGAGGSGGGEAGAAGMSNAAGDGGAGAADERPTQPKHVTACACSIERARSSGSPGQLAIAGLLAGVVLLRVKRARRILSRPS